jgi:hypothetical protein
MHEGSRDPATPWFDAAQDRVPDSPRGRLDPDHPLRRALRALSYPASSQDISRAMSERAGVTPDQLEWLSSSLPVGEYGSDDEVIDALGRWGAAPPGTDRPF